MLVLPRKTGERLAFFDADGDLLLVIGLSELRGLQTGTPVARFSIECPVSVVVHREETLPPGYLNRLLPELTAGRHTPGLIVRHAAAHARLLAEYPAPDRQVQLDALRLRNPTFYALVVSSLPGGVK